MGNTPPRPPIGLITTDTMLMPDERARIMERWEAMHTGSRSAHVALSPPINHGVFLEREKVVCAYCGQKVVPDGNRSCPNCAGHEFVPNWRLSEVPGMTINEWRESIGLKRIDDHMHFESPVPSIGPVDHGLSGRQVMTVITSALAWAFLVAVVCLMVFA